MHLFFIPEAIQLGSDTYQDGNLTSKIYSYLYIINVGVCCFVTRRGCGNSLEK